MILSWCSRTLVTTTRRTRRCIKMRIHWSVCCTAEYARWLQLMTHPGLSSEGAAMLQQQQHTHTHYSQFDLEGWLQQEQQPPFYGRYTGQPVLAGSSSYFQLWIHMLHTYIHPFNGPFSGTTQVSRYQKGETNLDFTEARDSEWQWHQLGQSAPRSRQITMPAPHHCFLQAGCPSCHPTNSVKALKALLYDYLNLRM